MNGTLTIAARELRERSFVFITAAVAALIPFIAAILPRTRSQSPLLVILVMGLIIAVGFTLALSIVLGGSIVARELADKRMSFYFSKPVSAPAIWFGKVLGAVVTLALCFAISSGPALLVANREWRSSVQLPGGRAVLALVFAGITFLLVSHAVNTAVRSRSPLVVADFAALAVAVSAVWLLSRPFIINGARGLLSSLLQTIIVIVPVLILAAGAWHLARGRTDLRRNHRELSKFFWSAMAIVFVMAGAFVAWVFSAGPRDIMVDEVTSNAAGTWVAISGRAAHRGDYRPAFLVDVKSGRSLPLSGPRFDSRTEFTRTSNALLAVRPAPALPGHGEVHLIHLNGTSADVDTGLVVSLWSPIVVSDDLRRIATYENSTLMTYDVPSKTMLAAVRLTAATVQMFFLSDDVLRVYASSGRSPSGPRPQTMRIYEFHVKTRQLLQTGSVESVSVTMFARLNSDGTTLVVNQYGGPEGRRVRLLDARTGAERAVLPGFAPWSGAPLSDGGAAFIASTQDASSVRIVDRRGAIVAEVPLPSKATGGVIEVVPGHKYVATVMRGPQEKIGSGWDLYVIDAQRGLIERIEHNYRLASRYRLDDPRSLPVVAGQYIIVDAQQKPWRWNALTGAKVKVL